MRLLQKSNPPTPKTSMILQVPVEILEKILENLPANRWNRRTLMACTLVATWWTGPSQRHLFSSVEICEGNYSRWVNGVALSRSRDRLLGYVRSLRYARFVGFQMRYLLRDSANYFSALPNLHNLTLCYIRVENIDEAKFHACFSTFRETLTSLTLENVTTSFRAFVALIDYFPNITTLRLDSFELQPGEEPVPSLSRPLRGKLYLRDIKDHRSKFYNQFVKMDLEYEELAIDFAHCHYMEFMGMPLRISTNTVESLRFTGEIECK